MKFTRRRFLKASLIGASAAPRILAATGSPALVNGEIQVAVVGLHQQGKGHMRTYLKMPGTRLVALCDVDSTILAERAEECAKAGFKVATYRDYRKLLEDKSIDAVVIATPNHQHALQTIWALQAGKDVYCEKPLSHNVWEGRQVLAAERAHSKNVVFAGTQNRSSEDIQEAIAHVRSGALGKVLWARGLCYKLRESIGHFSAAHPVPATIDYDLWTGPADLVPPHRNSPRYGPVHYDWHWFWNYGGGDITNQGIHQVDVARWFLGESALPPSVMSFGGRYGLQDDAETPNTLVSVFNYERAPLIFEVRGLPQKSGLRAVDAYRGTRIGVVVHCEHGYLTVSESGTVVAYDHDHRKQNQWSKNTLGRHRANFVRALQSRTVSEARAEECHLSSALCHVANMSYCLGREVANSRLTEAIRGSALTQETHGRVLDHLKANAVDVDHVPSVMGPLLKVDPQGLRVSGEDREIDAAASRSPLFKRQGRDGFRIPALTA